ncbi:protein-glutamate methylesterase/protein-glutamine glutaminase [Pseudomarimonas salicorniae]|uniref:Protein-glutamate methylesterase/protein-glutamine glutaminase n=1 Tax=Pseudomarimonas salicorniae TaxID=2933270 RepID=A0ABT0GKP7_9GAMM|nr:chemotaxis response regulator protein-glutamate methylesterase [Lysobacter sp. CAU 1642]MCK7595117.1 chemotaxis response regulator protein-glutamate methylesterase [Lysobacter sp. CAU 1642]
MSIRVLVVDDSALVRQLLTEILSTDKEIEVVGSAADPYIARDKIKQLKPDVLTLDVEMPRMDGLKFLENLMRLHPMPVVMVSSLTEKGADVTIAALELGAIDFVTKPKLDVERGLREYGRELIDKVKVASRARVASAKRHEGGAPVRAVPTVYKTTDRLVALGASTGGTEALRYVLAQFPPNAPAVVITQHIPGGFSRAFAQRLDRETQLTVYEASDGQPITPGHAYVAPGGYHLRVERSGARWFCRIGEDDPVNRHRPSVDVLFQSVATAAGRNAVAGILTGMGDDGARGMLALRDAGAYTLAQDEASSVVWGMPGSAVKMGAVMDIAPLDQVALRLLERAAG